MGRWLRLVLGLAVHGRSLCGHTSGASALRVGGAGRQGWRNMGCTRAITCPSPTVAEIQWLSSMAHLACYGDDVLEFRARWARASAPLPTRSPRTHHVDARSTRTTTGPVKPSVRSASRSDSAARLRFGPRTAPRRPRQCSRETVSASRASSITLRLPIADATRGCAQLSRRICRVGDRVARLGTSAEASLNAVPCVEPALWHGTRAPVHHEGR